MDRQTLNAMRFSATRWASRLTWPWMAVVGLLVFSSGIFFSVIAPAQRELDVLHQNLSSLQKQMHSTEKIAAVSIRGASPTQLAVFYDYLPAERSLPDWLEKIVSAAKDNELLLKQGDYRITRDKGGKLLRYQITLPLNGSYLNIRKFLTAVLSEIPTASLDNVKFERQKIGDSVIEASIELTLYFGRAS
ncbi:MAG: type 4a pilus biogenesis protein PilO [Methylophilaceae bacterium]